MSEDVGYLTRAVESLDLSSVEDGIHVSADQIEKWTGLSRETVKYQLATLKLKDILGAVIAKCCGREVWIRQEDYGLRVLTVVEAEAHGWASLNAKKKGCVRTFHRVIACVDTKQLTEEQRDHHDAQARINARMILHLDGDVDNDVRKG